jgi:hypothetical protein
MNLAVPLRERVLAAAAATPSLTRRQGRRLAVLGAALSAAVAVCLGAAIGAFGRACGAATPESVRLAAGWTLAAGALAGLVAGRARSTLVRSPQLLRAATGAAPVVLVLWLVRFAPGAQAPPTSSACCFALTLALAATPLGTFLALRRGAELDSPGTLGAAAGAMWGAWAQVPVLLWCPARGLAHAILAHALPVTALAILGAVAGRWVLASARWSPSPHRLRRTTSLARSRGET